jgi:hypothetical protein
MLPHIRVSREINQYARLLDGYLLDHRASFFVVIIKNYYIVAMLAPFDRNRISHLWQMQLGSNGILKDQISKHLKLVEISIVITLGPIKDE